VKELKSFLLVLVLMTAAAIAFAFATANNDLPRDAHGVLCSISLECDDAAR